MDRLTESIETMAILGPFSYWIWSGTLHPVESTGKTTFARLCKCSAAVFCVFGLTAARAWMMSSGILLYSSLCWLVLALALLDELCVQAQYLASSALLYLVASLVAYVQGSSGLVQILLQGLRVVSLGLLSMSVAFSARQSCAHDDEEGRPLLRSPCPSQGVEDDRASNSDATTKSSAAHRRSWRHYLEVLTTFRRYVHPRTARQHGDFVVMITSLIVSRVATVVRPLRLRKVISQLGVGAYPTRALLEFGALRLLNVQADGWHNHFSGRILLWCQSRLKHHSFGHALRLSADFHTRESPSETLQIIEEGQTVFDLLLRVPLDLLSQAVDICATLLVIGHVFERETCFVVFGVVIIQFWFALRLARSTDVYQRFSDRWHSDYRHTVTAFTNWRTVKEASSEHREIAHHEARTTRLAKDWRRVLTNHTNLSQLCNLCTELCFLTACFLIFGAILHSQQDVAYFVLFTTYWMQISAPVTGLAQNASNVPQNLVQAERLSTMLARESSVTDCAGAVALDSVAGAVTFENVSFGYTSESSVLHEISFHVTAGQQVAIVGASGSGKSTLFNLLLRLFDPSTGRILIDGRDLRSVQLDSYRARLGVVPQSPEFWNDSVVNNVRYFVPHATDDEVIAACTKFGLRETIAALPKGYQERLGESGQCFSGGERQRIALARLSLKKFDVVLLDEPTSSLDNVTEREMQRGIDETTKGKTTFVIAHRLSTIEHADIILVMAHGRIVERGTHQELLMKKGDYSQLIGGTRGRDDVRTDTETGVRRRPL